MAKYELFRRDSGEVMTLIVFLFLLLATFVFWLSFKLILMGVRGEFKILAEFSGYSLYFTSISPGLGLALIMAGVLILSLPRVIHPNKDCK